VQVTGLRACYAIPLTRQGHVVSVVVFYSRSVTTRCLCPADRLAQAASLAHCQGALRQPSPVARVLLPALLAVCLNRLCHFSVIPPWIMAAGEEHAAWSFGC
jgi:hypothetical protein